MKRLIIIGALIAMCAMAWATGVTEAVKATVLGSGWDTGRLGEAVLPLYKQAGIDIQLLNEDISTGSTVSMDALVASGRAPDMYYGYIGRTGKYMIPAFALPLNRFADRIKESYLSMFYKGDQLLGLPVDISAQGLCVNLDMLDAAGYMLPEGAAWTIDEFYRMCEAVKKIGKFGTVLFAKSQSADYLYMNWFASFGAQMFRPGDYSRVTINSSAGVATARFFQTLMAKGYIPPESASLVDDDGVAYFWRGKVAMFAEFPGWETNMQAELDSKALDKPFRYKLIRFPVAPGVTKVPASIQGGAVVAWKGSKVADRVVDIFINPAVFQHEVDTMAIPPSPYNPVKGVRPKLTAMLAQGTAIVEANGIWDQGSVLPQFTDMRKQWFPIFADLLGGKTTPEKALADYEAALNKVIK